MEKRNDVTEFVLLGLTQNLQGQKILFVVFLFTCIVTMVGSQLIVTVVVSSNLDSPMYFFLGYFSFIDAVYSTTVTRNMIIDLLHEKETISFQACVTQLFMGHVFAGAEILLLVVMVYDHYVATCKLLPYMKTTTQRTCVLLLLLNWVGGFLYDVVKLLLVYDLPFCGPNIINHFICDTPPLLKLACTDTFIIGLTVITNDEAICVVIFMLLFTSYGVILHSWKKLTEEGRCKILSNCGSHITVVVLFFVSCIFMYVRPPSTLPLDKYLSFTLWQRNASPIFNKELPLIKYMCDYITSHFFFRFKIFCMLKNVQYM